jgi:hypothetical protein
VSRAGGVLRVLPFALVAWACDGGVVEPPAPYELAGTYQATVQAANDVAVLEAVVDLFIQQVGDQVQGSYTIQGAVTSGGSIVEIAGDGTLTGTVTPAEEPMIDILVRPSFCTSYEGSFTGRFVPTTGTIFLGGSVDILEIGCAVWLSFDVVLVLVREGP